MKISRLIPKLFMLISMLHPQIISAQGFKEQLIPNGNTQLNVQIYPKAQAEFVILLHGGPGVPDPMIEIVRSLNEKYQVICFEQRGTGQSHNPDGDYSIEAYLSDIDAIADAFDLKSFHLFGHSWGGLYAQIYAQERPSKLKSLFLCSPSSGTNKNWKATEKEVLNFNKQNATTGEWLSMGWYSLMGMLGSNKAHQRMFYLVLKNYHKGYAEITVDKEQLGSIMAAPVNKTRKSIVDYPALKTVLDPSFPIMLTYGVNDIYGSSKQAVIDRYPTARFEEIKASGHIPWLHNPGVFERILADFYQLN